MTKDSFLKRSLWKNIWKSRNIYLFLLPGIVYFSIFAYGPMTGLILAFKKYNARLGILGSQWIGLDNFERLFITPKALTAITNTIEISLCRLVFEFPFPILLAILLNEMRGTRYKKVCQTIFTFPHFISWVIVSTLLKDFFSASGAVNTLIAALGGEKLGFLSNGSTFRAMLYMTSIWKSAGWSAIIYIAAIAGINSELYDAATIDGANRLQSIWHVTLPGIRSVIVITLILQVGSSMNAGFDQIYNMRNPVIQNVVDIIDTYVYDITFESAPSYGFSTAVGLFKSVINTILLVVANCFSRFVTGEGLFGAKEAV